MKKENEIRQAMRRLAVERKSTYTAKELNDIAKEAKLDMIDVMCFLKYGKVY